MEFDAEIPSCLKVRFDDNAQNTPRKTPQGEPFFVERSESQPTDFDCLKTGLILHIANRLPKIKRWLSGWSCHDVAMLFQLHHSV